MQQFIKVLITSFVRYSAMLECFCTFTADVLRNVESGSFLGEVLTDDGLCF